MESIKFSILKVFLKNPKAKFSKESKATSYQILLAKASNKARKERKKDQHTYGQECQECQSQAKGPISATSVDVLESRDKKNKKKRRENFSKITCYKSDKKRHYANTYFSLEKN